MRVVATSLRGTVPRETAMEARDRRLVLALAVAAFACVAPHAARAEHPPAPFDVEFTHCVESIGVGLAPAANVLALTPAPFIQVGIGTPVSPVVVRTANCAGIAVDGREPKRGSVVQIGAVIVPPDGHGDIDNYTFWYYTTDEKLAQRLQDLGVAAQHVEPLRHDLDPALPDVPNDLTVVVRRPGDPRFTLDGSVTPTTVPRGSFEAIWWQRSRFGAIRMDTSVPVIAISTICDMTLVTDASNALGALVGGSTLPLVAIQQFNLFAAAHMSVTANP
jgi:hypothetical protein